jgi:hypothetical protein
MNEKCAEIPRQKLEKHVWRPQLQQIFGVRRSASHGYGGRGARAQVGHSLNSVTNRCAELLQLLLQVRPPNILASSSFELYINSR